MTARGFLERDRRPALVRGRGADDGVDVDDKPPSAACRPRSAVVEAPDLNLRSSITRERPATAVWVDDGWDQRLDSCVADPCGGVKVAGSMPSAR
jgi:hypothetical protein